MTEYKSLEEAFKLIADARMFQTMKWPSTALENAGGRPFEEWIMLIDMFLARLKVVYAETPAFMQDGDVPNLEGRRRIEKYAAIVANLTVWAVQAAAGKDLV